ncbi:hypothetical protein AC1031_005330 [Aphanomyces cochlioides]|nr:hypothetical protein AC1031_005330 [Aphanomyces cochlioides]
MADDESRKRERIVAFYEKYNPENVKNIPEILRVFAGREEVLCAKLHKKYGCHPDILPGPTTTDAFDITYRPVAAPSSTQDPLDFRSAAFNAQFALKEKRLAHVQPLDNLYKCRTLLPSHDPNHIQTRAPQEKKVKKPAEDRVVPKKPPVLHAIAGASCIMHNVLIIGLDLYETGPLSLLRACLLAKAKVVVVVRRIASIRGTCTGYLMGFDKHMNLVLLDVTERYVPLHCVNDERGSDTGIAKWRSHPLTVTRYAKQLLIRGDNIVLVYPTNPLPRNDLK